MRWRVNDVTWLVLTRRAKSLLRRARHGKSDFADDDTVVRGGVQSGE